MGQATGTHSNLHSGYDDYESLHGTLSANTVKTETFSSPVAAVEVSHEGNVNDDIWVTLDTPDNESPSNPTTDGTSDSGNEMIRVASDKSKTLSVRCSAVKLKSSGAADYSVLGVRQ